jgi:CRP-like cAMP-binding protein
MTDDIPSRDPVWAPGTFLGSLKPAVASELVGMSVRRQIASSRMIMREGARDNHVVLLLSGFVKVTTAVEGFETLLGIRLPGEVIGEIGALTGDPRSATVTACGPVSAGNVARPDFEAFLRRRPEAATLVTTMVARQLRWANRRRTDFAAFPAHIRLARLLVDMADVCGQQRPDGSVEIALPISQPELAAMIAIAQATVQKAIHELRERRLIGTGYRQIVLLDPSALRMLADGIR